MDDDPMYEVPLSRLRELTAQERGRLAMRVVRTLHDQGVEYVSLLQVITAIDGTLELLGVTVASNDPSDVRANDGTESGEMISTGWEILPPFDNDGPVCKCPPGVCPYVERPVDGSL